MIETLSIIDQIVLREETAKAKADFQQATHEIADAVQEVSKSNFFMVPHFTPSEEGQESGYDNESVTVFVNPSHPQKLGISNLVLDTVSALQIQLNHHVSGFIHGDNYDLDEEVAKKIVWGGQKLQTTHQVLTDLTEDNIIYSDALKVIDHRISRPFRAKFSDRYFVLSLVKATKALKKKSGFNMFDFATGQIDGKKVIADLVTIYETIYEKGILGGKSRAKDVYFPFNHLLETNLINRLGFEYAKQSKSSFEELVTSNPTSMKDLY